MEYSIGKKTWAIAEGYIPAWSHGPKEKLTSHETACILNATSQTAHVQIDILFADREPAGPFMINIPPRRTRHIRFNDLSEPESIPVATDYSAVIVSDVPIVVQHTRLDSRQPANALLSTIAYSE